MSQAKKSKKAEAIEAPKVELSESAKAALLAARDRVGLRTAEWPLGEYEIEVESIEIVPSKPRVTVVNGKPVMQEPTKPDWIALTFVMVETGEVSKVAVPSSCDRVFRGASSGDRFFVLSEGKKMFREDDTMARNVVVAVPVES